MSEPTKGRERRQQERFFFNAKVKLAASKEALQNNQFESGIAANISAGGAFLKTTQHFALASHVVVKFQVTFQQLSQLHFILSTDSLRHCHESMIWIETSGIVIRVEKDGIGIIFDQDYQLTPMTAHTSNDPKDLLP